ncbi:MAG: tRNA-intron lyase [Candidatus Hydrothermarchaeales archaeon]
MVTLIIEDHVVVEDTAEADRLQQKGFGSKSGDTLELSLLEALYLLEKGSLKLELNGRDAKAEDITSKITEKDFHLRYRVYTDLRERGYIVKTGFKFGAHFRVYDRGEYPKEHSKFLVHCVAETSTLTFPELSRVVRLTEGVKKTLVFAVLDEEGAITYYTVNRITP